MKKKRKPSISRRAAPLTRIPVVRDLVEKVNESKLPHSVIFKKAGILKNTFGAWRRGERTPNIDSFEALANTMGYRLKLEKIEDEET